MCRVSQHVHIQQLCHISASVGVIFLSEGWSDSSTLLLNHLTLFCLGSCCPDGPDQLPQSDGGWHPLGGEKDICKPSSTVSDDLIIVSKFIISFSFFPYNYINKRIKKIQAASAVWLKVNLKNRRINCTFQEHTFSQCFELAIKWT